MTKLVPKKPPVRLTNTEDNHYKYYYMDDVGGGKMKVTYGRIGSSQNNYEYDISEWDKKLREKLRKGYTNMFGIDLAVGSIVRTPGNDLGIVVQIGANRGRAMASVKTENRPPQLEDPQDLSLATLDPSLILHQAFYPNLCKTLKSLQKAQ